MNIQTSQAIGTKYLRLRYGAGGTSRPLRASPWSITYFESAKATKPTCGEASWGDLVDLFRDAYGIERKRSEKLLTPGIIAGRCEDSRSNANVKFLSLIAADFDISPADERYRTFADMVQHLTQQGLAFIAYTTTSNTAGHNRYRVVMPLERDVLPRHWPAVWQAANAKFRGAFDPATKDLARLSILPAQWVENPFRDERKGIVTLDQPFNAFADSAGGAILTEAELAACEAMSEIPDSKITGHSTARRSHIRQHQTTRPQAQPATDYPPVSPAVFMMLTALNGPLVSHYMRSELPYIEGSRTYKFMLCAAYNAQRSQLPVNTDILIGLTAKWLRTYRQISKPADIERQAENALLYVQQNPRTER